MPLKLSSYSGLYANNMMVKNVSVGEDGKITISSLSHKDKPDEIYLYTSDDVFVSEDGS